MNASRRMSGRELRVSSKELALPFPCAFVSSASSTAHIASTKRSGESKSHPWNLSAFHISNSTFSPQCRDAFSLIEVVLAIGVVAFALLGIVGLFSSSMKNNRESSAQQEAFQAARMISSRMQATNFFHHPDSLGTLQLALSASNGATTNFYLYASGVYTTNATLVLTNESPKGMSNGTLYCVQMRLSENLLTITNTFPFGGGRTNPTYADWTNWPGLPLSVRVYSIPNASAIGMISNAVPVMTFDMVIPQ